MDQKNAEPARSSDVVRWGVFRIHGTRGWLSIEDPFNCAPNHPTTITIATGGDAHPSDSSHRIVHIAAADQYSLQATAFAKAILTKEPPPLQPKDSISNMALLDRLATAAGARNPVSP